MMGQTHNLIMTDNTKMTYDLARAIVNDETDFAERLMELVDDEREKGATDEELAREFLALGRELQRGGPLDQWGGSDDSTSDYSESRS